MKVSTKRDDNVKTFTGSTKRKKSELQSLDKWEPIRKKEKKKRKPTTVQKRKSWGWSTVSGIYSLIKWGVISKIKSVTVVGHATGNKETQENKRRRVVKTGVYWNQNRVKRNREGAGAETGVLKTKSTLFLLNYWMLEKFIICDISQKLSSEK